MNFYTKFITTLCFFIISAFSLNAQNDIITFNVIDSCETKTVFFDVDTSNLPNNATYAWNFGDGGGDSIRNPIHNYNNITTTTTFQVLLEVSLNGNVIELDTLNLTLINEPNSVSFTYNSFTNCTQPQVYNFQSQQSNPNSSIVSWDWFINNQFVGSGPSLNYTFNLGPNDVEIYGYSQQGCVYSYSETILVTLNQLQVNASSTPTTNNGCITNCDGIIDIAATGTGGPYDITLNPGSITQNGFQTSFTGLCSGPYQIEVFDPFTQCTEVVQVSITDSASSFFIDSLIVSEVSCNASYCDGAVEVLVSSGTPPYQFSIDGGSTFQTSNIFDSLCAGTYQVLIEDVNACTNTSSFVLNEAGFDISSQNNFTTNCINQSNSSFIELIPFGGTPPFTYQWSNGDSLSFIDSLLPGETYTVLVTDANGCNYTESFDVPEIDDCYTVSGHIYADVNGNCIYDAGDYPYQAFVDLTATAGGPWLWIYDYADANGYYEITVNAGTYFFDLNGNGVENYTLLCPSSNDSIILDANNTAETVDFFLQVPPPVQDLSISMYPVYTPTPGFAYKTQVRYCNDGTITMDGSVDIVYDNNLLWTPSGSATANGWSLYNFPLPDNHNATSNTLSYDFTNLAPGQCNMITITYETDPTAGLMPGDPIVMDAVVNPLTGDVTPNNNVAYYQDVVTSSWDPNDKAVYPVGDITVDDNDHDYYIRFQNEGNANAWRVIVRDTLDEDLHLRTLRNINASHAYDVTIEEDSILVFTFDNIQLVPKSIDEEASQGFVAFSISQNDNLPIGTEIKNTASIYFDFNPAIVTNTVVNTIVEKQTSISDKIVLNNVSVYPNPTKDKLFIDFKEDIDNAEISLYNLIGTEVYQEQKNGENIIINTAEIPAGVYLLKIHSAQGDAIFKVIKQ